MHTKLFYFTFLMLTGIIAYGQKTEQTDRVIIKLKSGIISSQARNVQPLTGNEEIDKVSQKYHAAGIEKQELGRNSGQFIYIIRFNKNTDIRQAINEYYRTNEIEYAEPDYIGSIDGTQDIVPNDQYFPNQWSLKNNGTFALSSAKAGADIKMIKAWDIEKGDSNIIVAVIDGGNKPDHPEFIGRIWNNRHEIANNGKDDDGNGYIDDVQGWNFVNSNNNISDNFGHGTNVTGIIGADGNNSIGYAGVDWHCKLMTLKTIDDNNKGFYSWWVSGIYYAADNGARVINMSIGGTDASNTLQNAITYALNKNIVVIASMGNTNSSEAHYPAACSGVIAVGATNPDDNRSHPFPGDSTSGSCYGNHISVVAPGNYIFGLNYQSNTNYYNYWGGTSQAAPHVSGLAALLLAQDPNRSPAQIKSIIEMTADDGVGNPNEDTPGWDQYYGYGRINTFKALSYSIVSSPDIQNNGFSVYPNPFSNQAVLNFSNPLINATLTLYNSIGQIAEQLTNINRQSIILHRNNLSSGLYYVRLTAGSKVIATQKMIITD